MDNSMAIYSAISVALFDFSLKFCRPCKSVQSVNSAKGNSAAPYKGVKSVQGVNSAKGNSVAPLGLKGGRGYRFRGLTPPAKHCRPFGPDRKSKNQK
jgi:hypothetical protein